MAAAVLRIMGIAHVPSGQIAFFATYEESKRMPWEPSFSYVCHYPLFLAVEGTPQTKLALKAWNDNHFATREHQMWKDRAAFATEVFEL